MPILSSIEYFSRMVQYNLKSFIIPVYIRITRKGYLFAQPPIGSFVNAEALS